MRLIVTFVILAAIAVAAFLFFFRSTAEPEPELSDGSQPVFAIDNASEAFSPAANLPDMRRAPVPAALFYRPNQIDLGEGYRLDPGSGRLSYAFNSIGSDGRERFTLVELTNNQGYVINTSYVDDQDLIRTRVRVDPNNGLSQDATNLLDNPCFDEAIRDQNIEAFEVCLNQGGVSDGNGGTIGGGGFSFPSRGSGDVTDLGKVDLNDFAQSLLSRECSGDQSNPGGLVTQPSPSPSPSPSQSASVRDQAVEIQETAKDLGDEPVRYHAARLVQVQEAYDRVMTLPGSAASIFAVANMRAQAIRNLQQKIEASPNRSSYSGNSLTNEPIAPDGDTGGLGLSEGDAPCLQSGDGGGSLWQNDAICGERSQLECLAAINDPLQIITDGKCATVPGPNDQPMVVCSGRNGGPVGNGTLPTPPDPDEGCNESDSICWTDPNSGPRVRGNAGSSVTQNYIDLIGLDHILVGLCSVGGCGRFPDR